MFRYIKYKLLQRKRKKIIAEIRAKCEHKKGRFLGRRRWAERFSLGPENGLSGYNTYESDMFTCKRCGQKFKFNTVHTEHYVTIYRRRAGISTYRRYDYVNNTEESGII